MNTILAIDPGNTVEKVCTGCGVAKPLSDHGSSARGRYGRQAMCKPCISARYYEPRKEQLLDANRARRATQEGRDRENRRQRERRRAQPLTRMVQEAKVRATKKGIDFDLSPADLSIPDTCPVLGIPISMPGGARADSSPSIDRIDSTKGYTRDNVRVISWRANRLKNDATLAEIYAIAKYMEGEA